MKTTIKLILTLCWAMASATEIEAQATYEGNTALAPPGSYLGWNYANDLDFKTNDLLRIRLNQNQSSTINGFTGIVQNGFFGISDNPGFFTGAGAVSMIHINGGNSIGTQYQGFRPWMRYGTIITSNDDLMYMGHRSDSTLNKTDAVISWSDNGSNSQFGPDNLRFIFTGETNYGGTSTSHTESGQEVMRISAAPAANMGVGNFSSNGLDEQPTERVDIDGTARLRNTPNNAPNALITGVEQIIDPQTGDYVLNYLEFPGDDTQFLAGDGTWQPINSSTCTDPISDWNSINGGADMAMGYTGACVEGNVSIGINGSFCKLFVGDNLQPNESFTNFVASNGNGTNFNTALYSRANGAISRAAAIEGEGFASQGGEDLNNPTVTIGVRGFASASMCFANTIGVWGEAVANPTCAGALAGYFVGDVHVTGLLTGPSDYNLKRNIIDVNNPLELLQELRLRNYEFKTEEFPYMQLPEGSHYGLIAQELEETLPHLVQEINIPKRYDEEGELVAESKVIKSVNYIEFIPILIGSVQQLQIQVDALSLELAACCSAGLDQRSGTIEDDIRMEALPNQDRLDQNAPNPFTEITTLRFTLGAEKHTRVCIYNSTGQLIDCLVDDTRAAGNHRVDWNTSNLAS